MGSVHDSWRLTPEDIESRTFSSSGRRGYDRDEVTAFLSDVADVVRRTSEGANRPSFDQLGTEAAALLRNAAEGAESLRRKGEEDAHRLRQEAEQEAGAIRAQAEQEADEVRARAEQEAESVRAEAAGEAERSLQEAELLARRLRNSTERECNDLLAEAALRRERLEQHERAMEQRIREVENAFGVFRSGAEAAAAERAELAPEPVEDDGVSVEQAEEPEEAGSSIRLEVESVQPRPIFENR
jgi:DivIVA domain-containing protein